MQYGLAQAKAQLSYLTQLVDAGQEVLIARHGQPLYKLVSWQANPEPAKQGSKSEPVGLADWQEALVLIRAKTKSGSPALKGSAQSPERSEADNFVAQWRRDARY